MTRPKQTINELTAENDRLRREVTRLTELNTMNSHMRYKYKYLLIKLMKFCRSTVGFDLTYNKTPAKFKEFYDEFEKEALPSLDDKD